MKTYTLAEASKITGLPRTTIQKYIKSEETSDQFHKERRKLTNKDLDYLIFVKLNLSIGKNKKFIENAYKKDEKQKKQLMLEAIEELKKYITFAEAYCKNGISQLWVKNLIIDNSLQDIMNAQGLAPSLTDLSEKISYRFEFTQKELDRIDHDFNMLCDEKVSNYEAESILRSLDKMLKKYFKIDYAIGNWYLGIISIIKSENIYYDIEHLVDAVELHIEQFRNGKVVTQEICEEFINLLYENEYDSPIVQNKLNELRMVFYNYGCTEKFSYQMLDQLLKISTNTDGEDDSEENLDFLKKIKMANDIFQRRFNDAVQK